jgi:hypothetical protein
MILDGISEIEHCFPLHRKGLSYSNTITVRFQSPFPSDGLGCSGVNDDSDRNLMILSSIVIFFDILFPGPLFHHLHPRKTPIISFRISLNIPGTLINPPSRISYLADI